MSDRFQAGDLVMLKSGSPTMTVDREGGGGVLVCHYFDYEKNTMVQVLLRPESLKKADPQ